jgi:hypothetical protein
MAIIATIRLTGKLSGAHLDGSWPMVCKADMRQDITRYRSEASSECKAGVQLRSGRLFSSIDPPGPTGPAMLDT